MSSRDVTEFDLRRPEFQDKRLTPEMFEFDATGEVVRKDRFERGIRRIHGLLISEGILSSRDQWVTEDVVAAVKEEFNKFNRLKDLIQIIEQSPTTSEYFHFDNQEYIKNIDSTDLEEAKKDPESNILVGFESCRINGPWEENSAWLEFVEVLVSLDDIKKEIIQISGLNKQEDEIEQQ